MGRGGDGDPLDALVLLDEATFPGCLILCRAIGMFRMTDEKGPDEKVLCIPVADIRREHIRDIRHVPEFERLEIQHNNGRPRGRAFFDFLRTYFPEPATSVEL